MPLNILAQEHGCRVVAISDVSGGLYNSKGCRYPLNEYVTHNPGSLLDGCAMNGYVEKDINEELLELDVDVLIPAAMEKSDYS